MCKSLAGRAFLPSLVPRPTYVSIIAYSYNTTSTIVLLTYVGLGTRLISPSMLQYIYALRDNISRCCVHTGPGGT